MTQLNTLHPGLPTDHARVEAAFGDTLFIHLTRHNKLDQAISLVIARQSGLWHRAPDGTELERLSAPARLVYDRSAIAGHLAELTALDDAWHTWFTKEKIDPLRISYDRLAADPAGVLADTLRRMGLDTRGAPPLALPTARLATRINRDWAERFNAGD